MITNVVFSQVICYNPWSTLQQSNFTGSKQPVKTFCFNNIRRWIGAADAKTETYMMQNWNYLKFSMKMTLIYKYYKLGFKI